MASLPQMFTREQLTSMKRVDIQRICKDYGVRANMKTDALIELLLDSINSNMSPLIGRAPPKPQHIIQPRRVSTRSSSRVSSLRSRGASGSSASNSMTGSTGYGTSNASVRSINKSQATQRRLGVGRPSAAGGSGYRKSTRSSSMAGGKRRPSRSIKAPVPQLTIIEEPEPTDGPGNLNQTSNIAESFVNDVPDPSAGDDIPARLAYLEAVLREIDPKRRQHSLRDIPSQLAWLKTSVQQREAEVHGLRGELNLCKAEILTLRNEVSRVGVLEGQLRFFQDTFDQMGFSSTSTPSKGKTTRRVSVPLGESNTNTPPPNGFMTLQPVPEVPDISESAQVYRDTAVLAPAATVAFGKRPREVSNGSQATKDTFPSENERSKRLRPERKRTRDGTERPALREKEVIGKRPEDPNLAHPRGAGESSGTSTSGTSSQPPSIGTPPPAHGSDAFLDEAALLGLCQAGASGSRGDMFPQYLQADEPFSPGSALKARDLAPADSAQRLNVMSTDFEPRRISTAAARPRTPTRSLGHERFRVAMDAAISSGPTGRNIAQQPFEFDEGGYSYPFGFNNPTNMQAEFTPRRDVADTNQVTEVSPPHMPLAVGFGLASHPLTEESPIRGPATTMYGTEIQNDTRFGDFGRDGIASGSSHMNFWGAF